MRRLSDVVTGRSSLSHSSEPRWPKSEGPEGNSTNAVSTAVRAEKEPTRMVGGYQVAAAPDTGTAVAVMLLHVLADLLEIAEDLATRAKEEIFNNHGTWDLLLSSSWTRPRSPPSSLGDRTSKPEAFPPPGAPAPPIICSDTDLPPSIGAINMPKEGGEGLIPPTPQETLLRGPRDGRRGTACAPNWGTIATLSEIQTQSGHSTTDEADLKDGGPSSHRARSGLTPPGEPGRIRRVTR